MRQSGIVIAVMCAIAAPSLGAITSIGPFTGLASEGFESLPNGGIPGTSPNLSDPVSILGGAGTVSGVHTVNIAPLYVWNSLGGFSLGLNGTAVPFDGNKGLSLQTVLTDPVGRFDFTTPIQDFGGYWVSAATTAKGNPPVNLTFYDSGGGVIGTPSFIYGSAPTGISEWHGWHSTTPIAAVEFTGFFAAVDGLQINIPAPGTLVIPFAALACASRRRRG